MALLPDADRKAVWAEFMQDVSTSRGTFGALSKTDLRAAVDALDSFLDTNAASINSAIPQPARGALTVPQKAQLLMFVVARRYLVGS